MPDIAMKFQKFGVADTPCPKPTQHRQSSAMGLVPTRRHAVELGGVVKRNLQTLIAATNRVRSCACAISGHAAALPSPVR